MHHTASPSLQREEPTPPTSGRARLFAALLGLSACTSDFGDPTPLRLILETPIEQAAPLPFQSMHYEIIPDAAAPTLTVPPPKSDLSRIDEVYWTAPEPKTPLQLASNWGIKGNTLLDLNPDLEPDQRLGSGTRLLVYRHDPDNLPQSIGSPNRGKLRNGMPLPEGESWRLRPMRRRAYGTHTTVAVLVDAFEAYGQAFPDGPKIRMGEIAKRTGGRVSPHASHRSGRDVDIGYISHGPDDNTDRWRNHSSERTFDAEKNWMLISELLKSGHVQTIYVSRKLQKLLHQEAAKTLTPEQLAATFEYPRTPESAHAKIQHWRGHGNHMHVRFDCEPGNRRCRARG